MRTYLFDACAAVDIYVRNERTQKAIKYILDQKNVYKQAVLFIPNICIAEVFNTLARRHFKPKNPIEELNEESYKKHLESFRKHIHWGRTLYPYDVNRYHIIAADKIIPIEHVLASMHERDHLSTFDILIIAMACELAYIGQPEDTYLVTCDKRMKRVAEELKVSDASGLMVAGPLGELEKKRWIPPNCLYLPDFRPAELKPAIGQPPFNR